MYAKTLTKRVDRNCLKCHKKFSSFNSYIFRGDKLQTKRVGFRMCDSCRLENNRIRGKTIRDTTTYVNNE